MESLKIQDLIRGLVLGGFDLTPEQRADRLQKAIAKTLFRRKTSTAIKAVNREANTIDFIVTTDTVDRDDERVMPESFKKHIKLYDENSIIMYGHRHDMPAVATTIQRTFSPQEFWITAKFAVEEYDFAALLWRLYSADTPFMSAVSAGFIPIKWSSDRAMKLEGQRGRTFVENELIEISLVNVPSNRDALQRAHTFLQSDTSLPASAKGYLEQLIEQPEYVPEISADQAESAIGKAVLETLGLGITEDLEKTRKQKALSYKSTQLENLDLALEKTADEKDNREIEKSDYNNEKGHGSPLVYMFTIKGTVERDQRDIRKAFGDFKSELGISMWDDFILVGTDVVSKPKIAYGFDDWNEEIWKIEWKRNDDEMIELSNPVLVEFGETEEIPTGDDKQIQPPIDLSLAIESRNQIATTSLGEGNAVVPPPPLNLSPPDSAIVTRQPIADADIKEFFDGGDPGAPNITDFLAFVRD